MQLLRSIVVFCSIGCVVARGQSLPATAPTTQPIDLSSPTLVSLDLHDAPLADAARALSDQSGTRQLMAPVDDATARGARPVTLHVEREPYLVAMTKMLAIAAVEPARIADSRMWLRKTAGAPPPAESRFAGPTYVTGPFLVIAQGVTSTRVTQATNPVPDPNPDLNVQFTLLAEPKVSVVALSQRVRLSEATDETGMILGDPQQQQPPPPESWTRSFRTLEANDAFTATFSPGRPVGRRIATLKGVIDLRVITAREVMRIEDVSVPHEGLRVRGHRASSSALVKRGPMVAEIDLIIERDGADDAAWNEMANWGRISRFIIADAQGRPIRQSQDAWPRNENSRLVLPVYLHPSEKQPDGTPIGMPVTLEWQFPAEQREMQVPVEFKDLPLP